MTNDIASMSRTLLEKDRLYGVFVGFIVERLSADQPRQDDKPQRRGQHFIHDFDAGHILGRVSGHSIPRSIIRIFAGPLPPDTCQEFRFPRRTADRAAIGKTRYQHTLSAGWELTL